MCQAIAARKRWRLRRPSCGRGHLLSAILATVLLFDLCDGYMSTMHLGRTLKALRARELELEQEQRQQQQEQERGSLPPEGSDPPSPDQRNNAVEVQEDSWTGPAGPVKGEHGLFAGTHPSWGGSPDDDSARSEPSDTPGKAASIPAANEPTTDGEAGGGIGAAGEGVGSLEEEQQFKLSTSPVAAAATATAAAATAAAAGVGVGGLASASHQAADAAARTARFPGEGEEESERRGLSVPGSDGEEMNHKPGTAAAGVAVTSAPAGATELLGAGRSSSSSSSIPADGGEYTAAREVEVELEADGAGSTTTAVASSGTTAAAATPARRQDHGLEEEEEEDEEEGDENEYPEGEEQGEEGGGVTEDEDVEAAAVREILGRRAARDLEVQAAAARAVEELPATQRECFEEVKAFAFGGAGEGEEEAGLSEEEVAALETVAICGDRDGVVLAFLRHSKFDVRKAKESMRRCCAWRRENEAEDIFKRAVSPGKMRKHRTHWPTGFHKEDRAGRPVFYDRVGQSDLTKLRAEPHGLDQDEMVQIFTQNMEARRRFVLTRLSREAGHPVDQMTTVLDLTGLGMRHMSKEAVSYTRRISDVFQDNYSGMTCSLLILNAPWVFSKGWQVIEGFLSEDTVAKVKVLGKGDAGLAQLEKYIPKENIPDFLGGESPAIIGPSDPLWADVDDAVRLWASGGDPFLDQAEIDRVSGRIRREREEALRAKSRTKSKAKAKARSEGEVEAKAEELLRGEEEKAGKEEEGWLTRTPVAVGGAQRRAPSGDGAGDGGSRRRARVKASRRAAAAAAVAAGGRRSKSRRQVPDAGDTADEKFAREGRDAGKKKEKEKRKKIHRRQRSGLASSSSSSSATGRPSSSSSRRRAAATPLSSSMPPDPTKAASTGSSGRRGSILRGSAVEDAPGSPTRGQGGGKKDLGSRSHKKKRVTWEDEEEAAETEDEEADDDGSAVAGKAFGERVLEGLGGGVVPVLRAWVSQLVAGLLAAAKILLSAADSVFRFLREAFFEQVEVEE